MIRLETDRLRLRAFTPADAGLLYALDRDPQVTRFVGPGLDDVAAYQDRIAASYAPYAQRPDGLGLWAVLEKSTENFLGWVCLRPASDYRFAAEAGFGPDDAELGYRLAAAAWGQGFATEASRGLIDDVRQRQPGRRIVATALETNLASIRVMEKCGLKFDGRFQLPGFDAPSVRYVLPRGEPPT